MMAAISARQPSSRGRIWNIPAAWAAAIRSRGRGCFLRSHAASVSTGQQVERGAGSAANVSTHRRWWRSFALNRATSGPVSRSGARSGTAESLEVALVGAQVRRGVGVDADDAELAGDV